MAFLIFLSGDLKGRKFEFDRDVISIGRSHDNIIQINDPSVSSKHCEFRREGETFSFTDLGSTNGSYLNGVQVTEPVSVSPKDTIQVGDMEIIFDAPELLHGNNYAERTTTTGIIVKPGNIVKDLPGDAESAFTMRKDNKRAWVFATLAAVAAATAAFIWFLIKLFRQ